LNPRIKGLGETVLRVKDRARMRDFYTGVIGLDVLHEPPGITFLAIAAGHGGHTQIIGLFDESMPLPIPYPARSDVDGGRTSLHHFAFEIDLADYATELLRLRSLGLAVVTAEHRWCHWRSMYVRDPEDNVVELVCYDAAVK
jgi:catechol 2,3-dioxygenase-like lactoylglutathione lyase family enzyme